MLWNRVETCLFCQKDYNYLSVSMDLLSCCTQCIFDTEAVYITLKFTSESILYLGSECKSPPEGNITFRMDLELNWISRSTPLHIQCTDTDGHQLSSNGSGHHGHWWISEATRELVLTGSLVLTSSLVGTKGNQGQTLLTGVTRDNSGYKE